MAGKLEDLEGENEAIQEDSNEQETEKLKVELKEANDKYLRLVAEFDNFRKRNARERMELMQTAGLEVIKAMLPVLDDSERAAKQLEKADDIAAIKEGVSLVFSKLKTTMQQKGLRAMESINEPFDADLHEAITEIPAPNEDMVGKVIDVVDPGYYLNDKLIRHAKVVVGK
ncbi:MAG: nucleotide exchange factor GrpE [Taibaiella sp.]|nr:nucleotide exchange factor GrpE [Taibaiella sp.]